ncbi:MAG TPA: hypothetical protein PLB02_00945 [Thermoanaerobaculia bacterium]|nr:hypothetical protein [Thermoanaerobaculia bacterium]
MTSRCHGVAGILVKSALPLRGMFPAGDDRLPECTVARMERAALTAQPEWPRRPQSPRDFIRKGAGTDGSWWLRTADGRVHRVDPAARLVECDPDSEPGLALTHDVVDYALPNLLSCGGCAVLHGALLETDSGCVAALGESGVGKSTLAARWVRSGRRFMSDDWFVVRPEGRRFLAYPSHPSIRLRERSSELVSRGTAEETDSPAAFDKFWYAFPPGSAAYCAEPRELRGLAFLRRPSDRTGRKRTAPIGSREAMASLVSSLILLEIDSAERWGTLLPLLARLEAGVPRAAVSLPGSAEDEAGAEGVIGAIEELVSREADALRS